jgi:hypothetical protein
VPSQIPAAFAFGSFETTLANIENCAVMFAMQIDIKIIFDAHACIIQLPV